MTAVKLSIIIPIYNAETYLKKNITCLLNQTVDSNLYEIILVNDGSTDTSESICLDLAKDRPNIKYYFQDNQGVSAARNCGINHAKGKYISFVDSDDYVSDKYVETILSLPKDFEYYIFNNFIVQKNKVMSEKSWLEGCFDQKVDKENILTYLFEQKLNAPWDKLFLKKIIDENNIHFQVGINMGEDLLFNLDYIENCKKIYISSSAIYYHVANENGLCSRKVALPQFYEMDKLYEELNKRINKYKNSSFYKNETNIIFLRNIIKYLQKLDKTKVTSKKIINKIRTFDMIDSILNTKVNKIKDFIRYYLLKLILKK